MSPTRLYFVSDRRGVQMTPEVRFVGSPYAQFGCYSTQYLHIFNQKNLDRVLRPPTPNGRVRASKSSVYRSGEVVRIALHAGNMSESQHAMNLWRKITWTAASCCINWNCSFTFLTETSRPPPFSLRSTKP